MFRVLRVSFCVLIFISIVPVFAGGLDRVLFDQNGKPIDPSNPGDLSQIISVEPKLKSSCNAFPNQTCLSWKIVSSSPTAESDLYPDLDGAFSAWAKTTNVNFVFDGVQSNPNFPYSYESDGKTINLDQYGNQILQGDFYVSFIPPAEISFASGEVSKTIRYIVPDLANKTGSILWAGIFLNPAYVPNQDYNLQSVVAAEVGRMLGLAPSAVRNSVMFPLRDAAAAPSLSSDDNYWATVLSSASSTSSSLGSMSGKIISGDDSSPWPGAHLQLILASNAEDFSQNEDLSLVYAGTFSNEDGSFSFPDLNPGSYVLFAESIPTTGLSTSDLGDWMQVFSRTDFFDSKFYYGAQRESNQEPILNFSPQEILYAAALNVVAGTDTSNVVMITSTANTNVPLITAPGSSNETLAAYFPPAVNNSLLQNLASQDSLPTSAGSSGGCSLNSTQTNINSFTSLLGTFFALGFLLWIRKEFCKKTF